MMDEKNMCAGCNCSPELTVDYLEKKEKMLEEKLKWVQEKKEELSKTSK